MVLSSLLLIRTFLSLRKKLNHEKWVPLDVLKEQMVPKRARERSFGNDLCRLVSYMNFDFHPKRRYLLQKRSTPHPRPLWRLLLSRLIEIWRACTLSFVLFQEASVVPATVPSPSDGLRVWHYRFPASPLGLFLYIYWKYDPSFFPFFFLLTIFFFNTTNFSLSLFTLYRKKRKEFHVNEVAKAFSSSLSLVGLV